MNEYLKSLDLKPGDRVNITHMNILVDDVTFDDCVRYRRSDGNVGYHRINAETTVKVIERTPKLPEHWPPQLGDVWSDGNTTVHNLSVGGLYNEAGGVFPSKEHLIRNHPDMKLVYRKGNALR